MQLVSISLRFRSGLLSVCLLLALFILLSPATGELAPTSLPRLAKGADMIVLAKVDEIVPTYSGPFAKATVVQAILGAQPGQKIAIAAYGTWQCDATRIGPRDFALFFLKYQDFRFDDFMPVSRPADIRRAVTQDLPGLPLFRVMDSGQGQLTACQRNGRTYLQVTKWIESGHFDRLSCHMVPLSSDLPFQALPSKGGKEDREAKRYFARYGTQFVDGIVPLEPVIAKVRSLLPREAPIRSAVSAVDSSLLLPNSTP